MASEFPIGTRVRMPDNRTGTVVPEPDPLPVGTDPGQVYVLADEDVINVETDEYCIGVPPESLTRL